MPKASSSSPCILVISSKHGIVAHVCPANLDCLRNLVVVGLLWPPTFDRLMLVLPLAVFGRYGQMPAPCSNVEVVFRSGSCVWSIFQKSGAGNLRSPLTSGRYLVSPLSHSCRSRHFTDIFSGIHQRPRLHKILVLDGP